MQTSKVAVIGGIMILIGGLLLAFYTASSEPALQEARAKSIANYVSLTQKAIEDKDLSQAEKFAKKALVIDPSNKKALKAYKDAILASNGGSAPAESTTQSTPQAQPATKKKAESEDEMGCI